MFTVERNKPVSSSLCVAPLDSPNNLQSLRVLLELLESCVGPGGRIQMVQNASGGHLTLTSDSRRLLASLSLSRQLLKLIVSSVQGHLAEFGDGGKFLTCACLKLITTTVQVSAECSNRRIYCCLYEKFIQLVCEYLNSETCAVCMNTDLTNIHVLLAFTRSLLSTRPVLNLTQHDLDILSELIVRCFVESIPSTVQPTNHSKPRYSDSVFIIGSSYQHPRESSLHHGLLLESPDLPIVKGPLSLNIRKADDHDHSEGDSSTRPIKLALVTCSMSGDIEEIVSATFETTSRQAIAAEDAVLDKWSSFCEHLANCNVGILLCQKVIHPRLKILLKSLGVMALDRLGSAVVPYVQDLTGAQPVVSVTSIFDLESLLGEVAEVRHLVLNDKSYLHLDQPVSSLVTVVLCSKTEECLEEFKACVRTCLGGLTSLVREGKLLSGGGCWQMHSSYMLAEKVKQNVATLSADVGCCEAEVLSALAVFRSSVFHHWCRLLTKGLGDIDEDDTTLMVDKLSWHCWRPSQAGCQENGVWTCCCGLMTSSSTVTSSQFVTCDAVSDLHSSHMVTVGDTPVLDLYSSPVHTSGDTAGIIGSEVSSSRLSGSCNSHREGSGNSYKKGNNNSHSQGDNHSHTKGGSNSYTMRNNDTYSKGSKTDMATTVVSHEASSLPCPPPISETSVTRLTVLDHFTSVTQALYKAVFTANLVLSLGQIICDRP